MDRNALLTLCAVLPCLVMLCYYDCRYRRLPNQLTIGLAAAALVVRFAAAGLPSLLSGILGAGVCGAFLLLPYLLHGAGGGDLKMIAAGGAVIGLKLSVCFLFLTSLAGVLTGLVMLTCGTVDRRRLKHSLRCIFDPRYDRKAGAAGLPESQEEKGRIPFGIAIAAGLAGTLICKIYFGL